MHMRPVEAALTYSERGWSVIPCNGKRALVPWNEYQTERAETKRLEEWWDTWPDAWVGVVLGSVSNLVRIDADGPEAREKLAELGPVDAALAFSTPSGGYGFLYQYSPGLFTKLLWAGDSKHSELRLQANGAYTILPPSSGYSWIRYGELVGPPEWLHDMFTLLVEEAVRAELGYDPLTKVIDRDEVLDALRCIPADARDTWLRVGMALHSMDDGTLLAVWDDWSRTCPEKYKEGECGTLWAGFDRRGGVTDATLTGLAWKHGWISKHGKYEPITDAGNARVLSRLGAGTVLHSDAWGWLAWTGSRWTREAAWKRVQELQKDVLNLRAARARRSVNKLVSSGCEDKDRIKRKQSTVNHILSHQSEPRIRGARLLAASIPSLSCDYRQFDKHPTLLNCANGTLDLETGAIREYARTDFLTQVCPTKFCANATCPRWEQFIKEVFDSDEELVRWFQVLLGYCLTGDVSHHVLSVLHGSGRNGKSTVVNTVRTVLGEDYATVAPPKFLVVTRGEAHPTKLVTLYGKRVVVDMETGEGARLDEELVKRLTGGDSVSARRMYEDFWEFTPTHKLMLITNHEPSVQGVDEAIWTRVRKIPFKVCFTVREDFHLQRRLGAEAEGVLRWMVDGSRRWFQTGFGPLPKAVASATSEYRSEQNTLLRFFEERLAKDRTSQAQKHAVISAYSQWCSNNRVRQASNKAFGDQLRKWHPEMEVGQKVYNGVKLL
jgi:P4 family phage/plasmid primase-like protien